MDSSQSLPSGDQTLNVEDRVEVTAFVERKAWILEKIKVLEGMPPIDVFYGVEQISPSNSGVAVAGLPTRENVASWMAEHEKIEAETEQFDKGDMIRLKKMAKAKSEQNLSPEDTDLIELTLETLFALDKLMHLLRVRRDMIEQMNMRLKWEDLRVGAWRERRAILDDIDRFVKTRARWSTTAYDELSEAATAKDDDAPPALARSPTSKFLSIARGARFSHSEALSKEAAAYASRVLAFHNTWITPSSQLLDKMIERKEVPEQILDEQDRLEDQTKELDLVSKFPMSLVMQWKKADELYGEFKKDQSVARTLQQDIEAALAKQPRPRLDEEFVSRTQAINTRFSQISDPMTSRSFPRPTNPRYVDQKQTNDDLARILSTELRSAIKAARQAASVAKQYHALAEAVKKIRKLNTEMASVTANLNRITEKLTNGTGVENPDGLPPSLESPDSLDPLRHSAFFALLPSVITDLESNVKEADHNIRQTKEALIALKTAKLEDSFKSDTEDMLRRLEIAKEEALGAKAEVERKADLLRTSRKVDEAARNLNQELGNTRERILQLVDRQRWKPERGRDGAPLTPDSPSIGLPTDTFSSDDAKKFLSTFSNSVSDSIKTPFSALLPSLGPALVNHLASGMQNLELRIAAFGDLVDFWEDVQRQADTMKAVRDQTHDLEREIEDTRTRLQNQKNEILQRLPTAASTTADPIPPLSSDVQRLRKNVESFTASLATRIPFVTRSNPPRLSAFDHLPFNPSALDHSVKTDVNAFSMSLGGGIDSLERHLDQVRLAVDAKKIDVELELARGETAQLEESLRQLQAAFNQTSSLTTFTEMEAALRKLVQDKDETIGDLPARIRRRLSHLGQAVSALETAPGSQDLVAHDSIIVARKRALSAVSNKVDDLVPKLLQMQERMQSQLEGAGLAAQLQDTVHVTIAELTTSQTSLESQNAAIEIVPLEADDASVTLDALIKSLDDLETRHDQTFNARIPELQTVKASVRSSKSFQDAVLAALVNPVLDSATATEAAVPRFKPQCHEVRKGLERRLRLVEFGAQVKEAIGVVSEDLKEFDANVKQIPVTCSLVASDCEDQILQMQTQAQNHLKDFDNRLGPKIASLRETQKRLRDSSLSVAMGDALAIKCEKAAQEVEECALRSRAQVVGAQASIADSLSFVRQAQITDKAIASVEGSLNETQSRTKGIVSALDGLSARPGSEEGGISLSEKLSLLHADARSLPELLERAVRPLLQNAQNSVQSLRQHGAVPSDPEFMNLSSQYESRAQQAERSYEDCLGSAKDVSARIAQAETRESERLEAEIASQKQAEQDRLRREQEEKERTAAEAAAAREAEIERKRKETEAEMKRLAEETARREEAERQARVAAELEAKRIADELARLKEAEDARRKMEEELAERRVAEEAERFAALQLAEEARLTAERAQQEAEAAARAATEDAARQRAASELRMAELEAAAMSSTERVDVFGLQVSPSGHKRTVSKEELDLKVVIASLRTRLRSLSLQSIIRSTSKSGLSSKSPAPTALPTQKDADELRNKYNDILGAFAQLPAKLQDPSAQAELKSLRFEMEASKGMMTRVLLLAAFSSSATSCDNSLSDLLEHLDSYPAPPLETTSEHQSDPCLPPEEQLSDRVGFTGAQIDGMKEAAKGLGDDERVSTERARLQQTWTELWEMSMDKINGVPSRPPSSVHTPSETGSQRFINLNLDVDAPLLVKKASYNSLRRSRASSSLSNIASSAAPTPPPTSNSPHLGIGLGRAPRSVSTNKTPIPSRSSSRISTRSISGPIASGSKAPIPPSSFNGSVHGSTFASRQRTMSNASMAGESSTTPRRTSFSRPRIPGSMMTPGSESSPVPGTRSAFASLGRTPKSSLANSTSRTPRSPMDPPVRKRKQYIPNQKHRVDVAVAKVVNELDPEYNVTVEPVSWKDQSGKYWIGDKDPKLCFCRILRSQTVMVRVGGGWVELSKFLRGHYDMFRVMPPGIPGSPPQEEEERWISSATLLAAQNAAPSPSAPSDRGPTTPEPRRGHQIPLSPMANSAIFAGGSPILVHRDGPSPMRAGTLSPQSPRIRAGSSSPLTPLQFMRKAESSAPDLPTVVIRPTTPSRIPTKSSRSGLNQSTSSHNPLSRSTGSRPAPTSHRLSQWRP